MSGTFMSTLDKLMASNELRSANDLSTDEDFWAKVREGYRLKPDYINLENGYYCIMPQEIMDRHIQREREVNFQGSWYMRNHRLKDNIEIRKKLAQVVGAKTEEVILTRNATESLDTIIAAYDWRLGDEAVMAIQDYGCMLDMFRLQARRYGLVNKKVNVPLHPKDDEEIVSLYEKAITPNTRLLMVSHMINITGQILPIQKICAMALARDGSLQLGFGLGKYTNRNVMDAYAAVSRAGTDVDLRYRSGLGDDVGDHPEAVCRGVTSAVGLGLLGQARSVGEPIGVLRRVAAERPDVVISR